MILEYLFFEKAKRDAVEKYNSELIARSGETKKNAVFPRITYKDFDKADYWIVKYEIAANSEQAARQLSNLNEKICEEFFPTVLTNESSEYYNKILYPLINKFERSLRKLLYLKVALCNAEKLKKAIQNMDKKDFGEIYNTLFVDEDFRTAARERIKKLNTRSEMYEAIDALPEHTAWDILIGNSVLTTIKDNFDLLKEYRNDVMHAHNIDDRRFNKAKKLFSDANSDLENQIGAILQYPSDNTISPAIVNTLYEKLITFSNASEKMAENLSNTIDLFAKLSSVSISPETIETFEKVLSLLGATVEATEKDTASPINSSNNTKALNVDDSEVDRHE